MEHDTPFFFTRDYDYRPSDDPMLIIAYKAGSEVCVTEECASRAVTLGFGNYPDFLEDDLFDNEEGDA